jgi:hypothetical protein
MKTRKVQLENSDVWLYCHLKKDCRNPKQCTVHARTDHHMRGWVQRWRADRGIMERICPAHGVGHPDFDEYRQGPAFTVHGCCGCCIPPTVMDKYVDQLTSDEDAMARLKKLRESKPTKMDAYHKKGTSDNKPIRSR